MPGGCIGAAGKPGGAAGTPGGSAGARAGEGAAEVDTGWGTDTGGTLLEGISSCAGGKISALAGAVASVDFIAVVEVPTVVDDGRVTDSARCRVLLLSVMTGVAGRTGRDAARAGVDGREEDACEDVLVWEVPFEGAVRLPRDAFSVVVVAEDRGCRAVSTPRRVSRRDVVVDGVLAAARVLLDAHAAARGSAPIIFVSEGTRYDLEFARPSGSSPLFPAVRALVSLSFIVCFLEDE